MAFDEDLSPFFDTDGHAVDAVFTIDPDEDPPTTITTKVILNLPTQETVLYDVGLETASPNIVCKTSEITGVVRGKTVVIETVTYKVERVEKVDDGKTSTVWLKT